MTDIKSTILVIDDEPQIRKLLHITLEGAGYKYADAENGLQGVRMAASVRPDLILLDLGLPDIDGKEVIAQLQEWSQIPIIIVSVRNDDTEIAKCLDLGASDYVTKPFSHTVLLARINANLRKSVVQEMGDPILVNGALNMDLIKHEVSMNHQRIDLTPKEYQLLRYLMTHRGKMLTHRQLLSNVWGESHGEDMQYLRVYISQLRNKIEINPSNPSFIVTEAGIGYRMEVQEDNLPEQRQAI